MISLPHVYAGLHATVAKILSGLNSMMPRDIAPGQIPIEYRTAAA